METTTYHFVRPIWTNEPLSDVPFAFAPDEERFSEGHVPSPARGFGTSRQAYVMGAALVGGLVRPVYSVGTLGLVIHTEPDEDVDDFVAVYGARVRPGYPGGPGRVVWNCDEWDARCRLGAAWAVVPTSPATHPADGGHIREAV